MLDCKSEKKKGLEGKRKEKEWGKGKEGGNIEKGKRKREKERVKKWLCVFLKISGHWQTNGPTDQLIESECDTL